MIRLYKDTDTGLCVKWVDLDSYLEVQSTETFLFCGHHQPRLIDKNPNYCTVDTLLDGLNAKIVNPYRAKVADWKMERIKILRDYLVRFQYPKKGCFCIND